MHMEFTSCDNKAIVWDVMLEADFFSGLDDDAYIVVRKEMDTYVESFDVEGTTLTDANKHLIRHMWDFIDKIRKTAVMPPARVSAKGDDEKALHRSSTI